MTLLDYQQVSAEIAESPATLLLGNGFSMALDPGYGYTRLFAEVEGELGQSAKRAFERVGGADFEGALRLLDDGIWAFNAYQTDADSSLLVGDSEEIRTALASAINRTHLSHAGELPKIKAASARRFLRPFTDVFTTNYDLLLYWVVMQMSQQSLLDDGFRNVEGNLIFKGWDRPRKMFHLHGALHIYLSQVGLQKHSWHGTGRPLKELIAEGLGARKYPHFVAEGTQAEKVAKIRSSPYLDACFRAWSETDGPVVALGLSFAENDRHIGQALALNPGVKDLFVGLHGGVDGFRSMRTQSEVAFIVEKRRKTSLPDLRISYFDSTTAAVWDSAEPTT